MNRIIFILAFLCVCIIGFCQTKYVRKFGGYSGITYSKDQNYIALSKGNEIFIYPSNADVLSAKLVENKKVNILSVYARNNNSELISVSRNGVSVWNYITRTKVADWPQQKEVIGSALINDTCLAIISEFELRVLNLEDGKTVFTKSEHSKFIRCVAASEDGRFVVTGGGDAKVIVQDAQTGKTISQFIPFSGVVRTVDINFNAEFIASGADDGTVAVTTLMGEVKHTLHLSKSWIRSIRFSYDTKYLAIGDEHGHIEVCSVESGLLAEKFNIGAAATIFLIFSPDGKELAYVSEFNDVKAIDVRKFNIASIFKLKDQKDRTPPQIYVSNPSNIQDEKVRVYADMVEVKGTLMDESGIRGLKVNGIQVPIKENNNFVIIQPLAMGDNAFVIEATDINDNIAVKRFTVQRKNMDGEEYDVSKARNFLFVVGINDYEHWPKLNNAVKDANDITSTLLKQYTFEFDNVTVIKNEQATRSNIYKSMRSLIEKVTSQDNLLIYFSGHGYFDPLLNEGYWIPVDAETNNSGDYLSNADILKLIGNINSQHTFLIADACFSGSLFSESKRSYAENVEKFKSRWGLASGRLEVVSDGAIGKNSPFATATITFLNENTKDKFSISELIQYVKMKVAETSDQTPIGNPLKVTGDDGGEMVLYKKKS